MGTGSDFMATCYLTPIPARSLFLVDPNVDQQLVRRNLCTGRQQNLAYYAFDLGEQLMLHLHGFQDGKPRAFSNCIAGLNEYVE